jgi:hypothetical protein
MARPMLGELWMDRPQHIDYYCAYFNIPCECVCGSNGTCTFCQYVKEHIRRRTEQIIRILTWAVKDTEVNLDASKSNKKLLLLCVG